MRKLLLCMALGAILSGCRSSGPQDFAAAVRPAPIRETPNLALGPHPDVAYIGSEINPRSDWPSIENGYRLNEVTYYTDVFVDNQYIFTNFDASFRTGQNVRSGVLIR